MKARRRDEWRVGDRCLMRAGYYSRDGQASKLVPGRVTRLLRDAAEIVLDTGKETTVRLGNLQHDEAWLDEQEQREAEKRSKLERERIDLRLVSSEPTESKALTYSLADKLRDSEPPAIDDSVRAEALKQIEALRARRAAPPPESEAQPEPEPQPQPEPEPAPVVPPAPVASEPAPAAQSRQHPMQAMLERVQDQLLAVYDEHEQATQWAAKLPELERKKRVLEAQEKQVRAALAKLGLL